MRLETLPYKSRGSSVDASIPARAVLNQGIFYSSDFDFHDHLPMHIDSRREASQPLHTILPYVKIAFLKRTRKSFEI